MAQTNFLFNLMRKTSQTLSYRLFFCIENVLCIVSHMLRKKATLCWNLRRAAALLDSFIFLQILFNLWRLNEIAATFNQRERYEPYSTSTTWHFPSLDTCVATTDPCSRTSFSERWKDIIGEAGSEDIGLVDAPLHKMVNMIRNRKTWRQLTWNITRGRHRLDGTR